VRFVSQKVQRALDWLGGSVRKRVASRPSVDTTAPAPAKATSTPQSALPGRAIGNGTADPWLERQFPGASFVPLTVTCKITIFRVKSQPYWRINDEQLGWGDRTTRGVEVNWIAGEHGDFMREPHVAVLGEKLTITLRRVAAELDGQGEAEATWPLPPRS